MKITDERLAQFQSLYRQRFGREISGAEALEQGTKLVHILSLAYKPMTKEEFDRVRERQKALGA